jgi:hypothetical protein
MAFRTQKISQMTPKGSDLEATDLLEVSTLESGSYVTRSITGQEIIDAASSGGVTSVTGSAPIASSGGTTPAISIATANTSTAGALSSTDWNTFNGKQAALVSGTNIKTINGSSVLGSGDLAIASGVTAVTATAPIASTGGATPDISIATANTSTTGALSSTDWNTFNNKLNGVHALLPLVSGDSVSAVVNGGAYTGVLSVINRLQTFPFIPNQSFTSASVNINVSALFLGANARILIYSNLNGKPDQKLYESANLDCSTSGIKTALVSFTFTAGVTYWLCTHFSATGVNVIGHTASALMSIKNITTAVNGSSYTLSVAFGSAPTTFGTPTGATTTVPGVFITVA